MKLIPTGSSLLDARKILLESGLKEGMNYVDLGSGGLGHFVFPGVEIVGKKGRVYAVDILKERLQDLESRARMQEVTNLEILWGDFEKSGGVDIAGKTIDLASLVNVAPTIKKNPNAFSEVARMLKVEGLVLLVDWNPRASFCPVGYKCIDMDDYVKIAKQQGFESIKQFEAGKHHYAIVLKRFR